MIYLEYLTARSFNFLNPIKKIIARFTNIFIIIIAIRTHPILFYASVFLFTSVKDNKVKEHKRLQISLKRFNLFFKLSLKGLL